jgi:hypothetical protein
LNKFKKGTIIDKKKIKRKILKFWKLRKEKNYLNNFKKGENNHKRNKKKISNKKLLN